MRSKIVRIPVGVRRAVGVALLAWLGTAAPDRFGLLFVVALFMATGLWLLQTRHPTPSWERALSVVAIGVTGWFALGVEEPSGDHRRGDGHVAAVARGVDVKPDRGLTVAMGIEFDGCAEPVFVTVVVAGTAEFFADNAERLERPVHLQVAIPDDEIRTRVSERPPTLQPGDSEDDIAHPVGSFRAPDPARFRPRPAIETHGRTVLQGDVYRWRDHLSPLIAKFRADWLHRRDRLGTTCYLHVPSLTGDLTAHEGASVAGAVVRGEPTSGSYDYDEERDVSTLYRPDLELTTGTAQIHAGDGSVVDELSRPEPNASLGTDAAYSCATDPATVAPVGASRGRDAGQLGRDAPTGLYGPPAVHSKRYLEAEFNDCSARVVMAAPEADFSRDLVLILLGALVSLAAEAYFRAGEAVQRPA